MYENDKDVYKLIDALKLFETTDEVILPLLLPLSLPPLTLPLLPLLLPLLLTQVPSIYK